LHGHANTFELFRQHNAPEKRDVPRIRATETEFGEPSTVNEIVYAPNSHAMRLA
jgi:hypothetical protein